MAQNSSFNSSVDFAVLFMGRTKQNRFRAHITDVWLPVSLVALILDLQSFSDNTGQRVEPGVDHAADRVGLKLI